MLPHLPPGALRSAAAILVIVAAAPGCASHDASTAAAHDTASSDSSSRAVAARGTMTEAPAARDTTTLPGAVSDTVDPVITVRTYLNAIRTHTVTRDSMVWEPVANTGDGFRTFGDTTLTTFRIGTPGRIEGAAGSRYVDIPVTLDLATRTAPIRLRGTVSLRRAVVDGATEAQRRWRIMRIQWSAPTAPTLVDSTALR